MLIIGTILGLLLLLVLALPYLLDLNRYREHYIPLVEQALDRKIEIGHIRLMWFPSLGLHIDNAKIYDDPSISQESFIAVSSIEVAVKWMPLFHRRLEVQSLSLNRPIVSIVHAEDGTFNLATLGGQTQVATKSSPSTTDASLLAVLGVEELRISQGTITYEDRSHVQTNRHQLEKVEIQTRSVRIGEMATVSLQAVLTPSQLPLTVDASLGPLSQSFDIPDILAMLKIGNSHIEGKGRVREGILDFDVTSSKISSDDLPFNLEIHQPIVVTELLAHVQVPLVSTKETPLKDIHIEPLDFHVQMGKSTIKVSGKTDGPTLGFQGTAPVVHSADSPFPLPFPHPFSLTNVKLQVEIDGPCVEVTRLTSEVFDGQLKAEGIWNRELSAQSFHIAGTIKSMDVSAVQKVIHPAGVSLTGTGEFNWNINGTLPLTTFPFITGRSHVSIVNGELVGIDILQRIEQALRLNIPLGQDRGVTSFSQFQGEVEFQEQAIPIKAMQLDGHHKEFFMHGSGEIKRDQSILVNGTVRLGDVVSGKITQQMPVAKVALQEGSLIAPFTIYGTVSDPKVRLDLGTIQKRLQKQVGEAVRDILKGDPKDMQELLKKGKNLLKELFGK